MYDDSFHQKLMDEAYDMWHKNKDWNYEEFVDYLDEKHKAAVLVGNLNYQVENGGFGQWDANGYSSKVDDLLEILVKFVEDTGSKVGERVIKLIETYIDELRPILIKIHSEPESPRMKSLYDDDYEPRVDELDDQYSKINGRFLEEFNEWLIKKYGETEDKRKTVE